MGLKVKAILHEVHELDFDEEDCAEIYKWCKTQQERDEAIKDYFDDLFWDYFNGYDSNNYNFEWEIVEV